jgi:biotin operon repressor
MTQKQMVILRAALRGMRAGQPVSIGQIARELGLARRAVACRIYGLKLRGYIEQRKGREWGLVVKKDEKGREIASWQEVLA